MLASRRVVVPALPSAPGNWGFGKGGLSPPGQLHPFSGPGAKPAWRALGEHLPGEQREEGAGDELAESPRSRDLALQGCWSWASVSLASIKHQAPGGARDFMGDGSLSTGGPGRKQEHPAGSGPPTSGHALPAD